MFLIVFFGLEFISIMQQIVTSFIKLFHEKDVFFVAYLIKDLWDCNKDVVQTLYKILSWSFVHPLKAQFLIF